VSPGMTENFLFSLLTAAVDCIHLAVCYVQGVLKTVKIIRIGRTTWAYVLHRISVLI
jgi:hypothetical protein